MRTPILTPVYRPTQISLRHAVPHHSPARVAGRISDAATAEDSGALVDASIGHSEPVEGESVTVGETRGWASRSGRPEYLSGLWGREP